MPADAPPPIRLILFGDSWVRDDTMYTWPELLGHHLGWPTVNVALPGSNSATLSTQCELLKNHLRHTGRTLHPDAWALVHAGGNDVLQSSPPDLLKLIVKAACCCCCLPCSDVPPVDGPAENIRLLGAKLRDTFDVRNLLVIGTPITVRMPLVARYLMMLVGQGPIVTAAGQVAVRRLNALFLTRVKRAAADEGLQVVAIDESEQIEAIAIGHEASDAGSDDSGGDTSGRNADEAAAINLLRKMVGPIDLWADMMHPSQRCHAALSVKMHEAFREAAPPGIVPAKKDDEEVGGAVAGGPREQQMTEGSPHGLASVMATVMAEGKV